MNIGERERANNWKAIIILFGLDFRTSILPFVRPSHFPLICSSFFCIYVLHASSTSPFVKDSWWLSKPVAYKSIQNNMFVLTVYVSSKMVGMSPEHV